jgi:hypothetical protein
VAFVLGVGASIAANIAAAHPTAGARMVAAWPALALLLVVEMLARPTRRAGRSGAISTVTGAVTGEVASGPADAHTDAHADGCALPGVPAKPDKAANRKSTGRPERPRTVNTAASSAARPESVPDREPPNSSPRQRARRPAAETRQLATAILAEQPHLSRAQVAAQLGFSRQWLYELLATPRSRRRRARLRRRHPSTRVEARR